MKHMNIQSIFYTRFKDVASFTSSVYLVTGGSRAFQLVELVFDASQQVLELVLVQPVVCSQFLVQRLSAVN